MKNITRVLTAVIFTAVPFTGFAGALDRPGTATPPPAVPGSIGSNTALAPGVKSLKIIGTVIQKADNGIVLQAAAQRSKEKPVGLVFIEGDFSKQTIGAAVTCMASDNGTYDYKPAPGAKPIMAGVGAAAVNVNAAGQIRKMTFVRW